MMVAPLKVLVRYLPEAAPVVAALARLHVDVGSVNAAKLYADAPADMRLLCVAVADAAGVDELAADLARELTDDAAARELVKRVHIVSAPLGAFMIVFPDLVGLHT